MHGSPEAALQASVTAARLTPLLLVAGAFALTLVLFYPGIMNYDARYVYQDSLRGFYGDWQSPFMTWLWRAIDTIVAGSAGMFLLIAGVYWLGIAVLANALSRRSVALGVALPLLALTPPLFAFIGVIWRDVLMGGCWLLAAATVFAAADRTKRLALVQAIACALVTVGVLLRPNALAAAPLLITYIVWPRQFRVKRAALAFVPVMITLFAIMQIVYYGVFDAKRQYPLHSIVMFDLGGVAHFSGTNPFPATWTPSEIRDLHKDCYDPSYWNVYWNGGCNFAMQRIEDELSLFGTPALSKAWREAILAHPFAYIQHRLAFFGTFLFGNHQGMWTMDIERRPKPVFEDRALFTAFRQLHDRLQPTPLFWMGTWFAACIALCVAGWRRRAAAEGAFVLGVCGSATLYVLSYLPLGVASEFRYVYWAVLASAAGLVVVLLPARPVLPPPERGRVGVGVTRASSSFDSSGPPSALLR